MRKPNVMLLTVAALLAPAACGSSKDNEIRDAANNGVDMKTVDAPPDAPGIPAFPCGVAIDSSWHRCAGNPLYRAGRPTPDGKLELSIGDPDVMFDADERKWKAWWSTGVAARFSDPNKLGIMYAESPDGVSWTVQATPALAGATDSAAWDFSKTETPSVVKVPANPPDRRYVMFYAGGNDVDYPAAGATNFTWYQIGVAFSADGKTFTRMPASESPYANTPTTGFRKIDGLVLLGRDVFGTLAELGNGLVADPEVIFDGIGYQLFFSSLASKADRSQFLDFGISRARINSMNTPRLSFESPNLNPVLRGGSQPSIIHTETSYELYAVYDSPDDSALMPSTFNAYYGIWKHTSSDLNSWSAKASSHDFSMANAPAQERYGMIKAGDMTYADGIHRYYYPTFRSDNVPADFYCPVRKGSVMPIPAGSITAFPDVDLVPSVISLEVAARR
jgi:hypothetical protein